MSERDRFDEPQHDAIDLIRDFNTGLYNRVTSPA